MIRRSAASLEFAGRGRRGRAAAACCLPVLGASALSGGSASGASSTTTVTVTVASATNIDASGCAAGAANRTDLGTLLPTVSSITGIDCSVVFGSSNDSSMLRVSQTDGLGVSMVSPTKGASDTGFDTDGFQRVSMAGGSDGVGAVAVQPDGKIIVTGNCVGAANDFCTMRLTTAGALDTTFSGDGKDIVSFGAGDDYAYDVVVQSDGKIVVGGYATIAAQHDFALLRYNANGTLDTSFDTDGLVTTDINASSCDEVNSLAMQPDGKIIAAGGCQFAASDSPIVRYNTDGSLDTTYSGDGISTMVFGTGSSKIHDIQIRPDGRLWGAGTAYSGSTWDFATVAFLADGSPDTSWSTDGRDLTAILAGTDRAHGGLIASDGSVLVMGEAFNSGTNYDAAAVKYTSAGVEDTSWGGGDGIVNYPVGATGNTYFHEQVNQLDGKPVLIGHTINGGGYDYLMVRITTTGALDTTFDGDGVLSTDFPGYPDNTGQAGAIGLDGRLVVAGEVLNGSWDYGVAEYAANGTFSDYLNATTDWDTAPSTNMFGACLRSVSGGASGQWTVDAGGDCTAVDTDPWNAIPTTSTKVAYASAAGTVAATANLRWGVRTSTSQPPGAYAAPVTFDVVAPNA